MPMALIAFKQTVIFILCSKNSGQGNKYIA